VEIPQEQVLGTVQLKDKSWNQITLERSGDTIRLLVNGQAVYRQAVDTVHDGRFGLLQDPERFQVRVRNLVLTGDWPEQLPDNMFAEKDG
jgi:hypothetical protein